MTAYMHFQLGLGRATAAIRVTEIDAVEYAVVGMAFCSPKDQFSRKRGRMIAEGRLAAGKQFCMVSLIKGRRLKPLVLEETLHEMINNPWRVPSWARKPRPCR